MANLAITYNSYDLNNSNVITSDIQDAQSPDRFLPVFNRIRGAGAVITDSNYYSKLIKWEGRIVGTSMANLESLIDTFHTNMAVADKNFDIAYNSSTRRYVCTPQRVNISRPVRAANWAYAEVDFLVTEYGKDTSTTSLVTAQTHTTASNTRSLTIGGSAPDQYIRSSLTVTAATGLTAKTISVTNGTTSEKISILRTWVVADVLIIDPSTLSVTVNGTEVDYTGVFPMFTPGTHNIVVDNDFTTRTITQTVDYVKRYL